MGGRSAREASGRGTKEASVCDGIFAFSGVAGRRAKESDATQSVLACCPPALERDRVSDDTWEADEAHGGRATVLHDSSQARSPSQSDVFQWKSFGNEAGELTTTGDDLAVWRNAWRSDPRHSVRFVLAKKSAAGTCHIAAMGSRRKNGVFPTQNTSTKKRTHTPFSCLDEHIEIDIVEHMLSQARCIAAKFQGTVCTSQKESL